MLGFLGPNLIDVVYSLIERYWEPRKEYSREEEYRDDLLEFLRINLNRSNWLGASQYHSIQKESGRHLADIGIDRKVGIELKRNLKTKAEADRLVGQVKGYLREYYEGVIIVLCGSVDGDKLNYLTDLLMEYLRPSVSRKVVRIILKAKS